jgi:phosphoglycolate phosphatase
LKEKRKMIKYVLFDLDGTLLSTLDTIAYHLDMAVSSRGLGKVTVEDCRQFIGNGARKLVTRALAKNGVFDVETVSEVLLSYNKSYDSDPLPLTKPYDGVVSLVDKLYDMGVTLVVVTNKPEPTAKKLVESFFPGKFAVVSGGREGTILKPDPTESLDILARLGGAASECAFIGDTNVDIYTGKNMKAALTIGVSWGFRSRDELLEAGADFVADKASDVLSYIGGVK